MAKKAKASVSKEEQKQQNEERSHLASTNQVKLALEQELNDNFTTFDFVRVHYLWENNHRANVWYKGTIHQSWFIKLEKDGIVKI